jgi:hypothetical protein
MSDDDQDILGISTKEEREDKQLKISNEFYRCLRAFQTRILPGYQEELNPWDDDDYAKMQLWEEFFNFQNGLDKVARERSWSQFTQNLKRRVFYLFYFMSENKELHPNFHPLEDFCNLSSESREDVYRAARILVENVNAMLESHRIEQHSISLQGYRGSTVTDTIMQLLYE